jgi:hypothetical protein
MWIKRAVLVESIRTSAGPRHKYICYLGSINEGDEDSPAARLRFWYVAERNLDKAKIAGEKRRTIETALAAVVARPLDASLDEMKRRMREREEEREASREKARAEMTAALSAESLSYFTRPTARMGAWRHR